MGTQQNSAPRGAQGSGDTERLTGASLPCPGMTRVAQRICSSGDTGGTDERARWCICFGLSSLHCLLLPSPAWELCGSGLSCVFCLQSKGPGLEPWEEERWQ